MKDGGRNTDVPRMGGIRLCCCDKACGEDMGRKKNKSAKYILSGESGDMAIGHIWLDMACCTSTTSANVKVKGLECYTGKDMLLSIRTLSNNLRARDLKISGLNNI